MDIEWRDRRVIDPTGHNSDVLNAVYVDTLVFVPLDDTTRACRAPSLGPRDAAIEVSRRRRITSRSRP
ncbi:hypothetical protein QFZ32_004505 [Streptomyces canus]|nr:hypothetical protein [Streptomyces canus]MDQ1069065.1 hypothetical protein [Streptomyces canus]